MKENKTNLLLAVLLIFALKLTATSPEDSLKYTNWQNLDPKQDKKMGVSVEKSYQELLAGKESKTIVVAILDGGVDIDHEDLQGTIWVNEGEIAGNGIDDDNNGYIDDVNGWNFIGNSDGENINHATLEMTRLYRLYNEKFADMSEDEIKESGEVDFEEYQRVMSTFEAERGSSEATLASYSALADKYLRYDSLLSAAIGKEDYSADELKKLKVSKKTATDSAKKFISYFNKIGIDHERIDYITGIYQERLDYNFNPEFFSREVIGDDEYVWSTATYGNNDVKGDDPSHGTMVSGVIGAVRNNNMGVNGVADNVKFMCVRTVPNGDEWDKDVASAIKYAIDNGADIINMSFGKSFSPQKEFVDSIVKLADENNVLLVHAAGNDGKNIDTEYNFPNKYADSEVLANNWITVGASAYSTKKKGLVASFSNYGKTKVDVFAPGHDMMLCAPDSKYEIASGTSFAAPVLSGVAALLKSYYPSLTAAELKEIILASAVTKDYKVILPGTSGKSKEVVQFSTLSNTGGLVNVYEALKLAELKTAK